MKEFYFENNDLQYPPSGVLALPAAEIIEFLDTVLNARRLPWRKFETSISILASTMDPIESIQKLEQRVYRRRIEVLNDPETIELVKTVKEKMKEAKRTEKLRREKQERDNYALDEEEERQNVAKAALFAASKLKGKLRKQREQKKKQDFNAIAGEMGYDAAKAERIRSTLDRGFPLKSGWLLSTIALASDITTDKPNETRKKSKVMKRFWFVLRPDTLSFYIDPNDEYPREIYELEETAVAVEWDDDEETEERETSSRSASQHKNEREEGTGSEEKQDGRRRSLRPDSSNGRPRRPSSGRRPEEWEDVDDKGERRRRRSSSRQSQSPSKQRKRRPSLQLESLADVVREDGSEETDLPVRMTIFGRFEVRVIYSKEIGALKEWERMIRECQRKNTGSDLFVVRDFAGCVPKLLKADEKRKEEEERRKRKKEEEEKANTAELGGDVREKLWQLDRVFKSGKDRVKAAEEVQSTIESKSEELKAKKKNTKVSQADILRLLNEDREKQLEQENAAAAAAGANGGRKRRGSVIKGSAAFAIVSHDDEALEREYYFLRIREREIALCRFGGRTVFGGQATTEAIVDIVSWQIEDTDAWDASSIGILTFIDLTRQMQLSLEALQTSLLHGNAAVLIHTFAEQKLEVVLEEKKKDEKKKRTGNEKITTIGMDISPYLRPERPLTVFYDKKLVAIWEEERERAILLEKRKRREKGGTRIVGLSANEAKTSKQVQDALLKLRAQSRKAGDADEEEQKKKKEGAKDGEGEGDGDEKEKLSSIIARAKTVAKLKQQVSTKGLIRGEKSEKLKDDYEKVKRTENSRACLVM